MVPTRLSRHDCDDDVPTPYLGAEKTPVLSWPNDISPTLDSAVSDRFTPVP